jgi:hypothetical protein
MKSFLPHIVPKTNHHQYPEKYSETTRAIQQATRTKKRCCKFDRLDKLGTDNGLPEDDGTVTERRVSCDKEQTLAKSASLSPGSIYASKDTR